MLHAQPWAGRPFAKAECGATEKSGKKPLSQIALPLVGTSRVAAHLSSQGSDERGAVFTRREVVEFILDLAGYTPDRPLHTFRILEPSFGAGDFLLPIVERLLQSYVAHVGQDRALIEAVAALSPAVRAVELHAPSLHIGSVKMRELLRHHGFSSDTTDRLIRAWIVEGDFLLTDLPHQFTHAVGNPPYVRQELIPSALMAEYRARYRTIFDRADLYVPFIERCLDCIEPGGLLGFICADRWMKNRYGGPLRKMVARSFHLKYYVDMVGTPAFLSDVIAYPAIIVIGKAPSGVTRIASRPTIDHASLTQLAHDLRSIAPPLHGHITELHHVPNGDAPWILTSNDEHAIARRLESQLPTLEEAGCKVGIGVATGADKVFIGPFDDLDVEADRKLRLVTTKDLDGGVVRWNGLGVLNPFAADGSLVRLDDYPRLKAYMERHATIIRNRNCAKRNPNGWYRTIDRILEDLAKQPKLLIPDIKGSAHIVYEHGKYYPHHNLYYITSDMWDLRALQAVLRSGIATLFVALYSTQMRGGYLRFQAQYLRRIRLPHWHDVSPTLRKALHDAAATGDASACNEATFELFNMTRAERAVLSRSTTGIAS